MLLNKSLVVPEPEQRVRSACVIQLRYFEYPDPHLLNSKRLLSSIRFVSGIFPDPRTHPRLGRGGSSPTIDRSSEAALSETRSFPESESIANNNFDDSASNSKNKLFFQTRILFFLEKFSWRLFSRSSVFVEKLFVVIILLEGVFFQILFPIVW